MNFETLILTEQNKIWTLTLNRPESLNALNAKVLSELDVALDLLAKKDFSQAQALIITGAGPKAFVAGADIKEMSGLNPDQARAFAEKGQNIFLKIEALQIPVIAAVNGFALGGGLELAMACDVIYASDKAKLGLPEVSLGLIPGFGGTVRLSRYVGMSKAREMIFTADMITASEAKDIGLVAQVVSGEELLALAQKQATQMATRGPVAVQMAKKSILKTWSQDSATAMKTEASFFADLFKTKDFQEGTQAFVEKRKAQFKGQ